MMRLFGLKLNSLLVIAVAALLALGAISAFADSDPPDPPGDGVTVDDGDTDGEGEGHAFGRDHGQGKPGGVPPNDGDGDGDGDVGVFEEHGDGPNPERGCTTVLDTGGLTLANGGTSEDGVAMARDRLLGFLDEGSPADQGLDGVQNALEKMCHGAFASDGVGIHGDGGDSEDHPGNGNAFGRGHGQGKPDGVPTNDGGDE